MGILGITNRTENWKTAKHFYGLDGEAKSKLVRRLLGEPEWTPSGDIQVELFWYGMRDYIKLLRNKGKPEPTSERFAVQYNCLFSTLRGRIEKVDKFNTLKTCNYDVSKQERKDTLYTNLANTEIDVVLETPDHLFIGEAKSETTFRPTGKWVLMHQLIRQYVMARILVACRKSDGYAKKKVIPFVVGDSPAQLKESHPNLKHVHQLSFMLDQCWLNEENVLSWQDIEEIASA